MVFNAPKITLFLDEQMFEVVFLEESISLYNEKSKCENASILRKYGNIWVGEKTNCLFWFLHKHDFIKNITCRNGYTNITSILCFVWRKCNSERISFHL